MKQQSPARPRFTSPWRASEQKPVGIAVLLASVSVGLFLTLLPYDFERAWGLPLLYTLRGPLAPPREVAIVALDQDSAKRLGMPPSYALWPRQRHAELVRLLNRLVQKSSSLMWSFPTRPCTPPMRMPSLRRLSMTPATSC